MGWFYRDCVGGWVVVSDDIPQNLASKTHTCKHSSSPMCFDTALKSCWSAGQELCAHFPGWSADTHTLSVQTAVGGGSLPVGWSALPRWLAPGSYLQAATGDTPGRETKRQGRVVCNYESSHQVSSIIAIRLMSLEEILKCHFVLLEPCVGLFLWIPLPLDFWSLLPIPAMSVFYSSRLPQTFWPLPLLTL